METRFYAHQYSYEELCKMTEIQLKKLRCDSPEDIEALDKVMFGGKKRVLPDTPAKQEILVKDEIKTEPVKVVVELDEKQIDKLKVALQKIKSKTEDEKLIAKIDKLDEEWDTKKAQKLIKDLIG
jgi:ABC-type phosphate/phosphonate transport system substrate-binding protein